ncbi:MAG: hypothetical protein JWN68_343 [Nocardioides sp.]|uniref:hypothetical protein n=1 Tax=Nocardioides sp. TaxID=35761 RepID=UPI00260A008A|nr:hypothetical protein [Nocardioides sp.]MCW2832390.1 hypothetical protein [Nocardioides sp.]
MFSPSPATSERSADSTRVRRRRRIGAATGALALLVAASPFLPGDSGPRPAMTPRSNESSQPTQAGAPGLGAITPELQAEIDRVVAEGPRSTVSPRSSAYALAAAASRCAVFEGQRYCLGLGWTTQSQDEVASRLATAAGPAPGRTKPEQTGDLGALAALRRYSRLSPRERAAAERAELTAAARSVAKVWLIRHEIQGVPLPERFLEEHPEAALAARTSARKHPRAFKILREKQVRPQNRTYYCGPATAQMIAWGWRDRRQGQALWADRLHTTSAGTSITDMVRVVNHNTGYDGDEHAGPYIVLDISDFTFAEWFRLMKKHLHTYQAPVVLHPILAKKYFPYLDDDASGHFQVGRGYDKNPGGQPMLSYFEPWDQSRFDPTEPRIARTQWQSAYKSYRANRAHFQHNLGL